MRTIKFRAWDTRFNDMHYYADVRTWHLNTPDLEECTLMQFTGLHDKNGKEVYEGDVLERLDEAYRVDDIIPVHRHTHVTNIGYFSQEGKKRKYNLRENPAGQYDNMDDWMSWSEEYEVIGNIYENPELLN